VTSNLAAYLGIFGRMKKCKFNAKELNVKPPRTLKNPE